MRGLLWAEWFAHSRLLLSFLLLWLGAAWIVPLFTHPGWIMVISFLYALVAGPSYGGSDAVDDCEEFTFSLPATRSDRFLARLAVSGFTLMMFVGLDFLVLGMDWQSTLKRFFLDAGLLEPAPELKPGLLYGLVMALPINVFCISFVVSSVVRRRFIVFTSWFWSLVLALGTLYLGVIAEEWWWHEVNGYFSLPMLLFGSVIILKLGHGLYRHKEVGDYGAPVNLPSGFLGWVIMWLVALILLVLMAGSLLKKFPQFFNT
ncbi:hypothetical protein N8637_00920 [Verrucomicrobia bacterium]|nr:hypothetical protein [Verrucomicrobiota bacterium]MDB4803856.1 hypothetical protein [Verrucomicrobiota bacterium]